jgi:tight adherence protein C
MPESSVYFLVLVFFIVAGIAAVAIKFFLPDRLQQRLAVLSNQSMAKEASTVTEPARQQFLRFMQPLARLALPAEGWEESPIRLRFMHAGWRGAMVPTIFFEDSARSEFAGVDHLVRQRYGEAH